MYCLDDESHRNFRTLTGIFLSLPKLLCYQLVLGMTQFGNMHTPPTFCYTLPPQTHTPRKSLRFIWEYMAGHIYINVKPLLAVHHRLVNYSLQAKSSLLPIFYK